VWGGACSALGGAPRPSRTKNCATWACSDSERPDDPLWGRLRYIRWLDTAQDLCHSKVTHPLKNTDFKIVATIVLTSKKWRLRREGRQSL